MPNLLAALRSQGSLAEQVRWPMVSETEAKAEAKASSPANVPHRMDHESLPCSSACEHSTAGESSLLELLVLTPAGCWASFMVCWSAWLSMAQLSLPTTVNVCSKCEQYHRQSGAGLAPSWYAADPIPPKPIPAAI